MNIAIKRNYTFTVTEEELVVVMESLRLYKAIVESKKPVADIEEVTHVSTTNAGVAKEVLQSIEGHIHDQKFEIQRTFNISM